ncbi:hypothetical protein E4T39_07742, partial [Aureobasidium subglaciale]
KGSKGSKGLGAGSPLRYRKGITKLAICRLARRGGVKRISNTIYNEVRTATKDRLYVILKRVVDIVEYRKAKTATVPNIVFTLNLMGSTIYSFNKP